METMVGEKKRERKREGRREGGKEGGRDKERGCETTGKHLSIFCCRSLSISRRSHLLHSKFLASQARSPQDTNLPPEDLLIPASASQTRSTHRVCATIQPLS
ncbi:hypothetical protein Q5P01_021797 [Channa striata]|uniref:Uncharacterized protein n=1 Tax=Channa striata TaxID=64152 RepID=A0AA88LVP2_CHASR|nr:hypothetical protein Q5P01_021797 [Channa striata]